MWVIPAVETRLRKAFCVGFFLRICAVIPFLPYIVMVNKIAIDIALDTQMCLFFLCFLKGNLGMEEFL